MGRTGVCWDNAMAESFFSALKNERVHRTVYATKARAKTDVIAYIEGFYNSRRRHSALGYKKTQRRPLRLHPASHRSIRNPSTPLSEINTAGQTNEAGQGDERPAGVGSTWFFWLPIPWVGSACERRPASIAAVDAAPPRTSAPIPQIVPDRSRPIRWSRETGQVRPQPRPRGPQSGPRYTPSPR
jgi:hypothetical protein